MAVMKKSFYSPKEIKSAFIDYFYGSGANFFFPHPKLDETPEKECKEIVKMRCGEFLEILKSPNKNKTQSAQRRAPFGRLRNRGRQTS